MASLLPPRQGVHLWVSPTVSGAVSLPCMLLVSGPWVRELWVAGYADTLRLDRAGYFAALHACRRDVVSGQVGEASECLRPRCE